MKTLAILAALTALATTVLAATPEVPAATPNDDESRSKWSDESNGLRARLALRRWKVTNGSGIIATYLELQNVGDLANPRTLSVTKENTIFKVTDKDGKEIKPNRSGPFSGMTFGTTKLVLPMDSFLRFRIGPTGHGIGRDAAAHLDLGIDYCWNFPKQERYLSAVLQIEKSKDKDDFHEPWHGRIELPPVLIPMASPTIDPDKLAEVIEKLGTRMLAKDGRKSERAFEQMSLIDDPRVVQWYVKAVQDDRYGSKCSALGRLGYFDGDLALEGLKIGINTKGTDIGSASRPKVADSLAINVRHYAANALARSPHPEAKSLLLSFHNDKAKTIRLSVVQAAAMMGTAESMEIVKLHTNDQDPIVQSEAKRLLGAHESP